MVCLHNKGSMKRSFSQVLGSNSISDLVQYIAAQEPLHSVNVLLTLITTFQLVPNVHWVPSNQRHCQEESMRRTRMDSPRRFSCLQLGPATRWLEELFSDPYRFYIIEISPQSLSQRR